MRCRNNNGVVVVVSNSMITRSFHHGNYRLCRSIVVGLETVLLSLDWKMCRSIVRPERDLLRFLEAGLFTPARLPGSEI